ncbi:liprin-beta-2 isoform X7 [Xenopus tropicalis]|uniref:Liprin-beta-2 isoform X7 n=2 Tax=Xenopus tropicalis TaxID=8364 RepID=A0A8J1JH81_XENTR|nr:liprin-beta-2 isoform X7 [Xenopus tropicalis]
MSDASHMLEAALEQMDDIIAGTKAATEFANGVFEIGSPVPEEYFGTISILHLVEELKVSLEMVQNSQERDALRNQVPNATAFYVMEWLQSNLVNYTAVNNETYQERLARLEGDKESLILQVSVLTDQVEVQGDKIRDLESCVEEHHLKLNATEEMLQQELLSRTSLETQKLDLMAELSNLKIKLAGLEKEKINYEDSHSKAEELLQELKNLKMKVEELENERTQYEWKLKATKAEIAQLQEQLALKDAEIERLKSQISSRTIAQNESSERDQEVQRLKLGMETLLAANEEKDHRIEELTLLLSQYRRVKSFVMAAHASSERMLSLSSEEEVEATLRKLNPVDNQTNELPKPEPCQGDPPPITSTLPAPNNLQTSTSPAEPCPASWEETPEYKNRIIPRKLCSSLEDLQCAEKHVDVEVTDPVLTPESKAHIEDHRYQTLPGKLPRPNQNGAHDPHRNPPSQNLLHVSSATNGIHDSYITRSISAPVIGEKEHNLDITFTSNDLSLSSGTDSGPQSPLSPESKKSPKGIKKFWGRIRRTPSGNFSMDGAALSEFKRGGLRATAGPRLSRTKDNRIKNSDCNAPFAQWSNEQVCNWLEDLGLGQYIIFARQWISSGHTLLMATPQALEKELGIKHPLHRKKLQMAINAINSKKEEKSGQLDHIWVTRWLDDIGLPQYKDQFHDSRVDGKMLQFLTVNDLLFLKVTSQLHHLSIKCAIHVLHANKFNAHCLRRRPADENNISPSEVVQWSNHRVMEWLRSVDLAEYAPNLRGSGVHGGLIILEPRFNSDTLAMLLNIPTQKTLLRRHLATNFNLLIGPEAQQEKREIMDSTSFSPLSTTAKVRPKKISLSNFGQLRKKKFDETTDYVCPVDATNGTQRGCADFKVTSASSTKENDKVEQMEHSEGTVKQIGAFSDGINNLTNMLSQDELLNNYRFFSAYDTWR